MSTEAVFEDMKSQFKPEKASGLNATIQFNIGGDDPGTYNAAIADGSVAIEPGEASSPNATVIATSQDWQDIVSGKLNPQMAFMTGKLKVQGDIGLATKLQSLFF